MAELNQGFNMDVYGNFKSKVIEDVRNADRDKTAVAHWVQGEEARVVIDNREITIGADDGFNMMEAVLASFAACDAAVVALQAAFMGLKINSVTVEANGHYNVAAYLGIEGVDGPGISRISTKIYVDAPDATPEQIAQLHHICEVGSPVGDTLTRSVPINVEIEVV